MSFKLRYSSFALFFVAFAGCGSDEIDRALASDPPAGAHSVGPGCESSDPNHYCLGLRYITYKNDEAAPVIEEGDAIANLDVINSVWAQCGITFQIEEYVEVDPTAHGLKFQPSAFSELGDIRRAFATPAHFLIVSTGAWDRSGSLGSTGANAWTVMPGGSGPYGVVLEKPVARYSVIFAHELGHYLGLGHVSDSSGVMNAIIYTSSTKLTAEQCDQARETVEDYWLRVLR